MVCASQTSTSVKSTFMRSEDCGLSQQINKQNGKDEIRQLFPGEPPVSLQLGQGRYRIPPEVILLSDSLDS